MSKNVRKNRMTRKDIEDWDELYIYVKENVLGYNEHQSLTARQQLKLKGLLNGRYIDNNNIEASANYPYKTVLFAFKYSMQDIRKALKKVYFKDDEHKFNYILKIVRSNIDMVHKRMKELGEVD